MIIKDLNIPKLSAKLFWKFWLMSKNKDMLIVAMTGLSIQNPKFLKRMITRDESWIYKYDPKKKEESEWRPGSPHIKKAHNSHSKMKTMLIFFLLYYRSCSSWMFQQIKLLKLSELVKHKVMLVEFFGWKGLIHHESVLQGQTVNKEYYRDVSGHLRKAACKKRSDLW